MTNTMPTATSCKNRCAGNIGAVTTASNSVVYEVRVSREETQRRMAVLIKQVYPAYLELKGEDDGTV